MKTKTKDKTLHSVRSNPDTEKFFQEHYGTLYSGGTEAVNVFPYFRKWALERLHEEITAQEFEQMNEVVPQNYLYIEFMLDPVMMMRVITNHYELHGGPKDFVDLRMKIGDIHPIHLFFLFSEIKRWRKLKQKVPQYTIQEFFNEDMF